MQPTHARWEYVPAEDERLMTTGKIQNRSEGDWTDGIARATQDSDQSTETIFKPIPAAYTHNFLITDSYYEKPFSSSFGYPGPDGAILDIGPPDLSHVPEHVLLDLPEDCRQAFLEAQDEERRWQSKWGTEEKDQARACLPISYNT